MNTIVAIELGSGFTQAFFQLYKDGISNEFEDPVQDISVISLTN